MKKSFIYILGFAAAVMFSSCEKDSLFNTDSEGLKTNTSTDTPKDTINWAVCEVKNLIVGEDMMVHSLIGWLCTNGTRDTSYMEPWLLDIYAKDMTIYRDSYQASTRSGITPDAERSSENEVKDKLGNLVVRHHYVQPYKFNNFTHSISGAWTTGRVLYGNGKEESYLPEDGLYYDLINVSGNTVNDTTHFVRNDSIFAKETVKLTYKATLKVSQKSNTWRSWERTATVTVISFVGLVEKPIPGADDYIANLKWHTAKANRFWDGSAWRDGILSSSDSDWYMLVTTFKLNHDATKEEPAETKMYSIAKSAMVTPTAGREFNAVMWDEAKNQPIPCRLTVDGNGWGLGSAYADGTLVTKRHDRNEAVMSGVKNLSEEDNATPSPWIASNWTESKYNGVNYYSVVWKTTTHTLARTIADASLKK